MLNRSARVAPAPRRPLVLRGPLLFGHSPLGRSTARCFGFVPGVCWGVSLLGRKPMRCLPMRRVACNVCQCGALPTMFANAARCFEKFCQCGPFQICCSGKARFPGALSEQQLRCLPMRRVARCLPMRRIACNVCQCGALPTMFANAARCFEKPCQCGPFRLLLRQSALSRRFV